MMVKIPVKFKMVAAVFNEGARIRTCDESSGSEHSADLSDLVNSFIEREIRERRESEEDNQEKDDKEIELESNSHNSELKDSLKKLLGCENDDVKRRIHAEVEMAYKEIGDRMYSSPELKRRLMSRLRDRGFNAGLCKTKWEKNGGCISGDYEYIDVNFGGIRYIIEIFLAEEFKIARQTDFYASLLHLFRPIFVGQVDELKQIVRLMCSAMKKSMKRVEIHVPPWRRLAYMQAKWFGSYKRTINEIPVRNGSSSDEYLSEKRSVGFVPVPEISFHCRKNFARREGARIGNLAAALKDSGCYSKVSVIAHKVGELQLDPEPRTPVGFVGNFFNHWLI